LVLARRGRSDRKIGLVSHLDTVFPPEEEAGNDFRWRRDGDRIYGPGTVDIKGGTVMIFMLLNVLQKVLPQVYEEITWVVLLNASEEALSNDFGDLCRQRLAGEALAALVFEGGYREDSEFSIVVARKGMAIYRVTVTGRASHAGSAHEKGANAIVQMGDAVRRIAALTDYGRDLTFNVGTVSGGTVVNRVPHHAEAMVEMRAFFPEVFEAGVAGMLALDGQSTVRSAEDDYPARVGVELVRQVAPWPRNPASDRLLVTWQEAAKSLGAGAVAEERGGLSDGNLFWDFLPTIDGLGPVGANAHCSEQSVDGSKEQEHVLVSSFVPKALLNLVGLLRLIGPG
jgi:glutamate carboxypeptidase